MGVKFEDYYYYYYNINLDKGGIDQFFTYFFIIIFKYFELFRFAQLFFKQNY